MEVCPEVSYKYIVNNRTFETPWTPFPSNTTEIHHASSLRFRTFERIESVKKSAKLDHLTSACHLPRSKKEGDGEGRQRGYREERSAKAKGKRLYREVVIRFPLTERERNEDYLGRERRVRQRRAKTFEVKIKGRR